MDESLSTRAVLIVYIIRHQQTRVRVNVHASLETLFVASQKHQVGQDLVAEDFTAARRRIRPANRSAACSGCCAGKLIFELVEASKELAAFTGGQVFDLF